MKPTSILSFVTALVIGLASAGAATRAWTGVAIGNNQWINITNWGLTLPANGDSLLFPGSAGNKSSVNNLTVTNYGTIFFAGSNYVFAGGTIGLSGGIVATNRDGTNTFATTEVKNDTLTLRYRPVQPKILPNVWGMGIRDALYLVENAGCRVRFSGVGKVKSQSILPGTKANGQTCVLSLD